MSEEQQPEDSIVQNFYYLERTSLKPARKYSHFRIRIFILPNKTTDMKHFDMSCISPNMRILS